MKKVNKNEYNIGKKENIKRVKERIDKGEYFIYIDNEVVAIECSKTELLTMISSCLTQCLKDGDITKNDLKLIMNVARLYSEVEFEED